MILAGGHRAHSGLRPGPEALTLQPAVSFGSRPETTTSSLQFHLLAQRLSQHLHLYDQPSSSHSRASSAVTTCEYTSKKRRPRHVPIEISPTIISSVLKGLPPSPTSPEYTPDSSPRSARSPATRGDPQPSRHLPRPRHIPIVIPAFAHPQGDFPPTPSTSADSTPRASPKPHSCEVFYSAMSGPNTSGSRTSTIDSKTSGPSPNQIYSSRFKPSSSTYLADMNSSSESSLNPPSQDFQSPQTGGAPRGMNNAEIPYVSSDGSPSGAQNSTSSSTATTNLSGLVCNVHKCTGREPLARVGATTTILGDKLYVFGGRILSRKQSMKVTSDMYELDLIRRHWTRVETSGSIPKPRYFHTVCALGDSKLICYGGMSPASPAPNTQQGPPPSSNDPMENMMVMSDIHVYDVTKRSWTYIATQDTPPGRYAHCAAVVPSSATFTSANAPLSAILHNPPSSIPNQGALGVALDGSGGAEMIVVGGQDSHNKYIDAISVFNLRSLKWVDTKSLERSCGAYRSVVTPLTSLPASKIGMGLEQDEGMEAGGVSADKSEPSTSMLIYSNYNFLDVKLELQARLADGSLIEKEMNGAVSPPGLRFPSGDILDNHFIVSGTYLTSSKHEYALWALDLRTLTWSRIDAGGGIFSQGSWNRGILWSRRNTFVILGNRKRVLVEDYNRRRINFSNICMVELEAFGLYDNPRRVFPSSTYSSISAPVLPLPLATRLPSLGGRPLPSAATDLGLMAMNLRDLADMDLLAINGERVPVNSHILSRRWGPYFIQLLRDSTTSSVVQNDASSSSDGGTLRPGHLNPQSLASRNSSITITPSINTVNTVTSAAPSSTTMTSNSSILSATTSIAEAPTPQNLPPSSRPRQLYLPHTVLSIRALVHFLYASSLPPPNHELCTPQILCSLLQLARPYRVDGLLEATVERLHQALDGRNAAAVFNAAAMAAGGGRGTGTAFGKEGDLDLADDLQSGLTITRLRGRRDRSNSHAHGGPSESSEDSESAASSSAATSSSTSDADMGTTGAAGGGRRDISAVGTSDEVWAGGVSCVVGLQKRGLRGLMEGRRMRERERGRTVGGLNNESATPSGGVNGTVNHANAGSGGGGGTNVGLGIA